MSNLLRHLNEYHKRELGYKLEAIESELAKQKKDASLWTPETAKAVRQKREDYKQEAREAACLFEEVYSQICATRCDVEPVLA